MHIKLTGAAGTPEPELRDRIAVRARNHHVIRNGLDVLAALVLNVQMPLAPDLLDATAEMHAVHTVGARHQPDFAAR